MPRYHNINGNQVQFTAEEETAREERAIVVAKEIEDHNNKIEQHNTKEIETSLFKELNNVISNLNIERLSGIIVITDGQIHDLHNYNKLLSRTNRAVNQFFIFIQFNFFCLYFDPTKIKSAGNLEYWY